MKVLHVPPRYFPAISGGEFYLQRLSEILSNRHDVEVLCTDCLDFKCFRESTGKKIGTRKNTRWINGVTVMRHPVLQDTEREKFLEDKEDKQDLMVDLLSQNGPVSPRLFESLIERTDADVMHTTFFPYYTIHSAVMAAKKLGIPCFLTPFFHSSNPRYGNTSDCSYFNKFYKVLACTDQERAELHGRRVSLDRLGRVTMGVDVHRFQNVDDRNFRKIFPFDPSKVKIVLFCGYKNYEKGAISILHSVPHVLKRVPDAHFIMIGPPTAQYNLVLNQLGKAREHVHNVHPANLTGYFDKFKLGAFKHCSAYVMPSRSDAFGISYLEAWASRKPVIAADIPAMREIFTTGREGLHVPFDEARVLAECTSKLLLNEDFAKQMGEAGFKMIHQKGLTWKDVASRVEAMYKEAVGASID